MKRKFLLLITFLFITTLVLPGCSNLTDIVERFGIGDNSTSVSSDISEEDLYNEFLEAEDFYYSWIYGQYYADFNTMYQYGVKSRASVNHKDIVDVQTLKDEINSHFIRSYADECISMLDPKMENGKLFINCIDGVGDNFISIDRHSFEKIDKSNYLLTLYLKSGIDEKDAVSEILCTYVDGEWKFGDNPDSKLKGQDYYFEYFTN